MRSNVFRPQRGRQVIAQGVSPGRAAPVGAASSPVVRRTIHRAPSPTRAPGAAMAAFDPARLAADVEAFCQELRPVEELCYVEHRFNDQLVPLAKKHNLL